jgi:hypothetical protein
MRTSYAVFGVFMGFCGVLVLGRSFLSNTETDIQFSVFNVGSAPVEDVKVYFAGTLSLQEGDFPGYTSSSTFGVRDTFEEPVLKYELLGIPMEHQFVLPGGVGKSRATGKALAFWIDSDCGTAEIRWQSSVEVTNEAYHFGKGAPRCDALATVKRLAREREAKTRAEKPE